RDAQRVLAQLDVHPQPVEREQDRGQIARLDPLDREVAPRDRGEAHEAPDLDVLRADRPLAAAQALDASDAEHVRLDSLDLRAERDEEAAEILDVRLAGGVADR